MRKPRRIVGSAVAVIACVGLLSGGLASAGTTALVAASAAAPQRAVTARSGAQREAQIAALKAALANIDKRIAAGKSRWGALDLRDIYSYKVDQLWLSGVDGYGTAVAVLEGWDYPAMQAQLNSLDAQIGLPDTTIQTVYPDGPLPAQCPPGMVALGSYGSCRAWQGELFLDVQAVHMIAPYAKIVISATPSDSEVVGDPSSEVAMPEIMKGLEYLGANKLANVASISDGSSETDYSRGAAEIRAQDPGELTAAADGIPVANATGDCGAAQNLTTATRQCGTVSSGPASATWADSPWVTAVGGTSPQHTSPCPPCTGAAGGGGGEDSFPLDPIEGAGLSEIYPRPDYQDRVAHITGSSMRSLPDITMNSRDGTSEAAPLFAGVLALATQLRGRNLGPINEVLYDNLARDPARNGLVDVTSGNNSFGSIPGYSAGPGYDVASGWGTVDASKFVPALARAARHNRMSEQAAGALAVLQHTLSLTPSSTVSPTATVDVTSTGFLPGHPVHLAIDGAPLVTVTADTSGNISYSFTASAKGLAAGRHTLSVTSMLLVQSRTFTVRS